MYQCTSVVIPKFVLTFVLLCQENGTLKAEMERALREKRSVESELEKVGVALVV